MTVWRIVSLVGSLMGARLAGAALGFAVQLALARTLAPVAVGTVMLGMSLAAFFSLLATAGYPALGLTTVARYHSLGRRRLVAAYFASACRDMLALWGIGGAALALVLWLDPMADYLRQALFLGALAAVPYGVMRLNNIAANSLRRYTLSIAPDFVARPALLLGAIALMAASFAPLQSWQVLLAFVLVNLGVASLQAFLLGRDGALSGFETSIDEGLAPILRRRAVPLALVALVSIAYGDLITLLAGLLLPPAEVAVVGIAIKIATLAGFMAQSLQQFVLRDLTAALARGTAAETRSMLLRINLASIGLMIAAVAGALLFGDLVLSVFGETYRAGHWALVLFMASQLMRAAGGMNMHLLSLRGEQGRTALMCLMSVVVLAAVAVLAVPRWGVLGLAVAVAAADFFWAVALGSLARRDSRTGGDVFALLRG